MKVPAMSNKKNLTQKPIAIALQGGGSHGSFAWGVMDKILEDGRFYIQGVSGTSAGGMNATAIVQGLAMGGNEQARKVLFHYWKSMSELAKKISPVTPNPLDKMTGNFNLDRSPTFMMAKQIQDLLSPYQLNPLNLNPFQDFIKDYFDFPTIHKCKDHKLFLAATNVRTGKIKIFSNEAVNEKVLMATACLPFLFQTVEIEGEPYWDGGYIANPAIFPLIEHCSTSDVLVVQLRKTYCNKIPTTQEEITDRLKEITFNGCLVREMRAIHFITNLIDQGVIPEGKMKRVNMHLLKNEEVFQDLNLTSALNTDWDFLMHMFEEGRKTAAAWLEEHFDRIGDPKAPLSQAFTDFIS